LDPDRLAVQQVVVGEGSIWAQGAWAQRTTGSGGHEEYISVPGAAIAKIDPATDQSLALLPVGSVPRLMAFDSGALWLWGFRDGTTLERIDPKTGKVTGTVEAPEGGRFIAVGGGAGWVAMPDGSLEPVALPSG